MRKVFAVSTLSILVPMLSAMAQTPTFLDLGASEGYRLAIPQGTSNYRVGNAVLVRLVAISQKDGISFSPLVLVACDGSWVTTAIQTAYKLDGTPTVQEMFTYAKESEESLPLEGVFFESVEETQLLYAKPLSRRAPALCKTAGKEPRNMLVPIAGTNGKDDTGSSVAIVLGTTTKAGHTVDVWSRTTNFRLVPILSKDGQPWEYNGQVQKKKEVTGKYSMERRAFSCNERTMATYESVDYQEQGSTPKSWSSPRDKLALSSVVPGSVGEAQLEAVCTLYGSK